jgi:hypothetical protein
MRQLLLVYVRGFAVTEQASSPEIVYYKMFIIPAFAHYYPE